MIAPPYTRTLARETITMTAPTPECRFGSRNRTALRTKRTMPATRPTRAATKNRVGSNPQNAWYVHA